MQIQFRRLRLWLWVLGLVVLIAGYVNGFTAPDQFAHALAPALKRLEELAQTGRQSGEGVGVGTIFVNNAMVAVLMMAAGVLAGIVPVLILWFNGLLMGYVVQVGAAHLGVSAWRVLAFAMLPHGVLELAGLLWAASWGLYLGYVALYAVYDRVRAAATGLRAIARPRLRRELRRAALRIPALLVILLAAAWVEVHVTPGLMARGLNVSP
ncbi:stage II sporulation protein M [Alicyclobacillus sp.]|uniref:stage II sporulation protein M n=1 Tax=Alicyclobacillus sp. TaxID=61169 RepID=UPI0025C1140D|nr:stage II sporulation protein M [Alicyclobacillus sp.]MCL6516907.1 stage II sporulation protein M [Alicyclobacillus sp.]